MEGAPKSFENIEMLSDWRELRDQAPAEAAKLISEVEGYEEMSFSEKIDALQQLLDTLKPETHEEVKQKNKNRFLFLAIEQQQNLLKKEQQKEIIELSLAA